MRLAGLDQALCELDALVAATEPRALRGWPVSEALLHCAQSIDASIDGFPRMKPAFIRKTIGKLLARRFLRRGELRHDITAPVPGAPAIEGGDLAAAIAALRASIARFQRHQGALAPHFVFDALDKRDYDRLHAMHIADHLGAIAYR